jgi:hypothetical protein
LVKKLDEATSKNKDAKLASYVVFLDDADELEKKLKSVAEKEKLQKTILLIDNPTGPKGFKIEKDAAVTVILYKKKTVESNFAFKKGELNDKAIEKILNDIPKITK